MRGAGFACRPEGQGVAAKECDVAEVCDGVSPACPLDLFDPGDDGDGQNCPVGASYVIGVPKIRLNAAL